MSDLDPTTIAAEARRAWDETPKGGRGMFEGTPMSRHEELFRRQFVEPMALMINAAYKRGELNAEEARLAHDACLSPIPSRQHYKATR